MCSSLRRDFDTRSMFRRADVLNEAVTLLLGHKRGDPSQQTYVITLLFDRSVFSEDSARVWWEQNQQRILCVP